MGFSLPGASHAGRGRISIRHACEHVLEVSGIGFNIETVPVTYTVKGCLPAKRLELIIYGGGSCIRSSGSWPKSDWMDSF